MKVEEFLNVLGTDFYAGVPDSQLKALCNYLIATYGVNGKNHIIAANEGNAVGLAAGYHLATGKTPVVYMQNSGEGNAINPICSLLNEKVYAIPCIFVIGWRGEPGVHDEPQHIFQGEITCKLLDVLNIEYMIISDTTTTDEITAQMTKFNELLSKGKQVAFVVRKGALSYEGKVEYKNNYQLTREQAIEEIVKFSGDDPIVSTTGKASRELFEIRERNGQDHSRDFLTVGSMGHSSSIALEIAMQKPDKRVWVIDGDGAMLMHMGSLAVNGSFGIKNIVHILINNSSHETVGGQPTSISNVDTLSLFKSFGFEQIFVCNDLNELKNALKTISNSKKFTLLEIKTSIYSRNDLGRPTTTAIENKNNFMANLKKD